MGQEAACHEVVEDHDSARSMNLLLRHASRTRFKHILNIKRRIADARPFAVDDLIILREARNRSAPPILTRPLAPGKLIHSHKGVISHDDLIEKRVRDVITSNLSSKRAQDNTSSPTRKGTDYRLHGVRLEEYVVLTKRLVTPIYPADAALIVDLLDLHHDIDESPETKLEILEAGTGHGALTLYLSRAIHAANARRSSPDLSDEEAVTTYKRNRRAVVHTIERKARYSHHARTVVNGFRRGIYAANIDFYVSDVGDWVRSALIDRSNEPFLSHAILDLPNADAYLADVAAALRVDGTIVVFNPSLTQILTCFEKAKEAGLMLDLDKVIELPSGAGSGGREWDVRAVRPRSTQRRDDSIEAEDVDEVTSNDENSANLTDSKKEQVSSSDGGTAEGLADKIAVDGPDRERQAVDSAASVAIGGWQMVCRPKVGERIVGGGFLGVFRKQRNRRGPLEA